MTWLPRPDSLRHRLMLGTLVWVLLTLALAWWGLSAIFTAHVHRQFDAELATHLNQLAAQVVFDEDTLPQAGAAMSDPRFVKPRSGLYWQVDAMPNAQSEAVLGLLRSRSLWDEVLQVPVDVLDDGEIHVHMLMSEQGERLRMIERVVIPADVPDAAFRFIVAADQRYTNEPVKQFRTVLALSLGVLSFGFLGVVVIQLRLALKPLNRLRHDVESLHKGKQTSLNGLYPKEIQPLVAAFNKVVERNAEIVQRARTQAGNLAHAVKTPLTVLANAAQSQHSDFGHLVRDQVASARAQIDHHLARARAAAAVQLPGQQTSVRPVVESLVRVMTRVHDERKLSIKLLATESVYLFRGEEQDLMEMLGNLIDNACKWANALVQIKIEMHDDQVVIEVEDDGPGLPAERREQALKRGVRLDERPVGSGLGLAIVRELAQLYGGDIALSESPMGGLKVALCLPAAM